jgi:hypothetical protein
MCCEKVTADAQDTYFSREIKGKTKRAYCDGSGTSTDRINVDPGGHRINSETLSRKIAAITGQNERKGNTVAHCVLN